MGGLIPIEDFNLKGSALGAAAITENFTMRDAIFVVPQIIEYSVAPVVLKPFHTVAVLLKYGIMVKSRGRKKKPMDVEHMVNLWREVVIRLITSHSKEERDKADFQSDELLGPILVAPVADLRRFVVQLSEALQADERVPFFVWSSFDQWTQDVILKSLDAGPAALKTELAREIAELVEKQLPAADIAQAIAGALQWRPAEDLVKVKANLEKGATPRIQGRQSCLFLEVGGAFVML